MVEFFAQKKRNRPIAITDIAILKVPRVHIFGFKEDEDIFIQKMHQKLLTMSKELNASKEVGIMIDIIENSRGQTPLKLCKLSGKVLTGI